MGAQSCKERRRRQAPSSARQRAMRARPPRAAGVARRVAPVVHLAAGPPLDVRGLAGGEVAKVTSHAARRDGAAGPGAPRVVALTLRPARLPGEVEHGGAVVEVERPAEIPDDPRRIEDEVLVADDRVRASVHRLVAPRQRRRAPPVVGGRHDVLGAGSPHRPLRGEDVAGIAEHVDDAGRGKLGEDLVGVEFVARILHAPARLALPARVLAQGVGEHGAQAHRGLPRERRRELVGVERHLRLLHARVRHEIADERVAVRRARQASPGMGRGELAPQRQLAEEHGHVGMRAEDVAHQGRAAARHPAHEDRGVPGRPAHRRVMRPARRRRVVRPLDSSRSLSGKPG